MFDRRPSLFDDWRAPWLCSSPNDLITKQPTWRERTFRVTAVTASALTP